MQRHQINPASCISQLLHLNHYAMMELSYHTCTFFFHVHWHGEHAHEF